MLCSSRDSQTSSAQFPRRLLSERCPFKTRGPKNEASLFCPWKPAQTFGRSIFGPVKGGERPKDLGGVPGERRKAPGVPAGSWKTRLDPVPLWVTLLSPIKKIQSGGLNLSPDLKFHKPLVDEGRCQPGRENPPENKSGTQTCCGWV